MGIGDNHEDLADRMRAHKITVVVPQFFNAVGRMDALGIITARDGPIFDLHIYDECHYLPTTSWGRVLNTLAGAAEVAGPMITLWTCVHRCSWSGLIVCTPCHIA